MSTIVDTIIKLRKDTADNFAKVAATFVPIDGEACIVDTGSTGIRLKVGDGKSTFQTLQYIDTDSAFKHAVIIGYYADGEFYTDTVKTSKYTLYPHQIYLDYITNNIYYYNNERLVRCEVQLPNATAEAAGVMKLYSEQGSNTNGTITQKFFTDTINGINFAVEKSDNECLTLSKVW